MSFMKMFIDRKEGCLCKLNRSLRAIKRKLDYDEAGGTTLLQKVDV